MCKLKKDDIVIRKKVDVLTIDYFFKHANCKKDDYEIDFQIVNNFFKHEN